jgi:hypothetical protein
VCAALVCVCVCVCVRVYVCVLWRNLVFGQTVITDTRLTVEQHTTAAKLREAATTSPSHVRKILKVFWVAQGGCPQSTTKIYVCGPTPPPLPSRPHAHTHSHIEMSSPKSPNISCAVLCTSLKFRCTVHKRPRRDLLNVENGCLLKSILPV